MAIDPDERAVVSDSRPKGVRMKQVAWGYVTRDIGNGKELLIATRIKKDDPLRAGEFVVPGGGLEPGENYFAAARREVLEETDVVTLENPFFYLKPIPRTFEKHNLRGNVDTEDCIILKYQDSGKEYKGRLVRLFPTDLWQIPREQNSDAKEPRYVALAEAFRMQERFTPACQVLLDIVREYERS